MVMSRTYQYFYTICDQFAPDLFPKQCTALEKHIPNLQKDRLLKDVDSSTWQFYSSPYGELVVRNDYSINELYIESDFDIEPYFS
jgi:hypothetical protein